MKGSSWDVVRQLGLVANRGTLKSHNILIYGSSDPLPNPAEIILTQLVARKLGVKWGFFVYFNGKNLVKNFAEERQLVPELLPRYRGVFFLEQIIDPRHNLREIAVEIWNLRREPVIIAHRPDGRPIRATTTSRQSQIPALTIYDLHTEGGWLGGSAIHWLLRRYALFDSTILYICPFQQKGRVYEIYKGVGRGLFVLTPFVRIAPPVAPAGWEPLTWSEWRALPEIARRRAYQLIKEQLENFFREGEPRRIELPWGWWEY